MLIAYQTQQEVGEVFDGEIEVDEDYLGGERKSNRGRGAGGKLPAFSFLKLGGCVYTKIILDVSNASLLPIIKCEVVPDSIIYSNYWQGYNGLDISEFKHYCINHLKLFVDKSNHINGIENFWNQAKRHMRKFNGLLRKNFGPFSKEYEWRFNSLLPKAKLKLIKQWVKQFMG
ncbi:IS1595 family transposase [Bartonella sp. HY038]|uniref:IS1595 family transposase n=1 Tax=Bartonella sp. HY038 TaxID=2759660 RepID=UPI0015FCB773